MFSLGCLQNITITYKVHSKFVQIMVTLILLVLLLAQTSPLGLGSNSTYVVINPRNARYKINCIKIDGITMLFHL